MRIVQTVIQLPVLQRFDKCRVILERTANSAPNYFGLRVILGESRNQNVKGVSDSAARVMDDVIVATYRRPNKALGWKSWIRDGISRIPLLAGVCHFVILASTQGDDARRQIARGMNLSKPGRVLQ